MDANGPSRVVIVGGGFGGLNAAKALAGQPGIDVTLIDRHNHHLFQPLLYQVATAGLSPADIATPIRTILRGRPRSRVLLDNVTGVDFAAKAITTASQTISYDYLILACGARHSYFGHQEWEEFAPGLKSLEEATEIRRRVLTAYELAEKETDPERKRQLLTFVVIGGGPTGVELAGALAEISRQTLRRDFTNIDPGRTRVLLLEAGPRILASFDPSLSAQATADLERLGVGVWTESRVTDITKEGVFLGDERVRAATVLWAAGVQASKLNQHLGAELDRQGRVVVEPDCSLADNPSVFVLGDQAHFAHDPKNPGVPLPGLCPVAIQQGKWTARNILRELKGKPREAFRYVDKGQMATIGRKRAICEIGKVRFRGMFAWLAWLLVHIYFLIGFRNRLMVMLNWGWAYLTFRRGARLIVSKDWRAHDEIQPL